MTTRYTPAQIEIDGGGQHCKVKVSYRADGSAYVSFTSRTGYGYPGFELHELKALVEKLEKRTV